jgi:hypothetical protein
MATPNKFQETKAFQLPERLRQVSVSPGQLTELAPPKKASHPLDGPFINFNLSEVEAVFFLKRHLFQLAPTLLDLIPGSCLRVGRLESPVSETRSRSSNRFEWVKFE